MTLTDAAGHTHSRAADLTEEPRIVSLVPSLTELLCELGLRKWLVGRTGFCIHPREQVADVPKVGGTKAVNIEKIRALAPTHLVVNIDENEKPTVDALAQFVPHIIVTHPLHPQDNLALYRLFGNIFGASEAAQRLCEEFEKELRALEGIGRVAARTVLYCIWKDPWMTVSRDTYIARMLGLIGWQHWSTGDPDEAVRRYPRFCWSQVLADEIDEILLSTEPYRFTEADADALKLQTGKPVRLVDGEMISWYGSHAIKGLRYLQQLA